MIVRTILAIAALALLPGCLANMKLQNTLTERGMIATRGTELGQVYLWTPGKTLGPVSIVTAEGNPEYWIGRTRPQSVMVKFEGKAEFSGGVDLTPSEAAALEAEVAALSTTRLTDSVVHGFRTPLHALTEAIKAEKAKWYAALEIDDGFPADPDASYVVMAYEQTLGSKLEVLVNNTRAAGAEFTSTTVQKSGASVKFQIVDASTLEISKSGENRVPVFVRLVVFRMTEKSNGNPQFRTLKDAETLRLLERDLKTGL